jgi:hypothetical protein
MVFYQLKVRSWSCVSSELKGVVCCYLIGKGLKLCWFRGRELGHLFRLELLGFETDRHDGAFIPA